MDRADGNPDADLQPANEDETVTGGTTKGRVSGDRSLLEHSALAHESMLRRAWSQPAFRPRASLLTTMLEGRRDYRTIYSMAVAGMAWLGINMVVQAAFQLMR